MISGREVKLIYLNFGAVLLCSVMALFVENLVRYFLLRNALFRRLKEDD